MLDFVVQLTKDATKIQRDDHDKLRAAGFDDKAILQLTLRYVDDGRETRWESDANSREGTA